MHPAISDKQADIAALCRDFGVKRLEIFGSAARGTDFDVASSDADFLVEFLPGNGFNVADEFFGLHSGLVKTLGREVDLINPKYIRNPHLLKNINFSRELVYAA